MAATDTKINYYIAPLPGGDISIDLELGEGLPDAETYDEAIQAFADVILTAFPLSNAAVNRTTYSADLVGPWYP